MSLLDDVSIVVTPNGYKAGTLFGIIPVPTLGAEEITNGDFSTDSNWTKGTGWSISGGTASCDGSQTGVSFLTQNGQTQSGKTYKVTYEVVSFTSGEIIAFIGGSQGETRTSIGVYTEYLTTANANFWLRANSNFVGSIDNISVKEYTSADMDVTRATAATRVDENGLVNYAEVIGDELVTNGDFATDLSGWTLSVDTPPTWDNGMMKMQSDGVTFSRADQSFNTVSGKVYSFVFEKLINNNIVVIKIGTSKGDSSLLNLTPTTVQTYSYSFTATSSTSWIRAEDGSGTTGAYLSGFSVKQVDRDNVPRIDYTGGGCPHILAEPQRTNLITYSEDFSQWNNARTTDTSNQATSPDGTNNATYLEQNTGETNAGSIYAPVTVIATDYSFSIFAKKKEKDFIVAYDTNANRTYFNISNGTLGNNGSGGTSKIEDYGNGWYRCSVSYTESSAASTNIAWYLGDTNGSTTVTDSGGVYIYGCQLEAGSYPTSYIPTSGSTVTRNQDIFTRDGIGSLINSTEGVLFLEMASFVKINPSGNITLTDGSGDNRIYIYYLVDNSISVIYNINSTGAAIHNFALADITQQTKIAVKWGNSNVSVWINGSSVLSAATSNFLPNTLNQLSFSKPSGSVPFEGKVKQLQVYDTALTDTQLAALTS
jgi:hypothetical protein